MSNTFDTATTLAAVESNPQNCPYGCPSCTEHLTRPCCVLLEVTQRCNLGCPVCFADSQAVCKSSSDAGSSCMDGRFFDDPSLETIATWYAKLFERAGACHIQLSGGEPTLRDDLEAIIRLGQDAGFSYFQLNTNGLRLAEEPELAVRLKTAGLSCVFLQFDGMSNAVHRAIRGRDLQAIKEAAVDACVAAELPVILVPTVIGGVNEKELMPLVAYGISRSPTVRGVHLQPMARFGRVDIAVESAVVEAVCSATDVERSSSSTAAAACDDMSTGTSTAPKRLTNLDIIALLEEQSGGMICARHFSGGNAEHSDCSINAHYFITDEGGLEPSGVQRSSCCDAVELAQDIQVRRWGTNLSDIPAERPPKGSMDEFLWKTKARSFAITGMAFMDCETLDLDRLRQCYLFIVSPAGSIIPFCAYNIVHRRQF